MSLKLGERFHKNSLGTFYYDPETDEVTIRVEHKGEVFHEHRSKAYELMETLVDPIRYIIGIRNRLSIMSDKGGSK